MLACDQYGQLVQVSSSHSIPISKRISDLKPGTVYAATVGPGPRTTKFLMHASVRAIYHTSHYNVNTAHITMDKQSNRTSHLCSPHHQLKCFSSLYLCATCLCVSSTLCELSIKKSALCAFSASGICAAMRLLASSSGKSFLSINRSSCCSSVLHRGRR